MRRNMSTLQQRLHNEPVLVTEIFKGVIVIILSFMVKSTDVRAFGTIIGVLYAASGVLERRAAYGPVTAANLITAESQIAEAQQRHGG